MPPETEPSLQEASPEVFEENSSALGRREVRRAGEDSAFSAEPPPRVDSPPPAKKAVGGPLETAGEDEEALDVSGICFFLRDPLGRVSAVAGLENLPPPPPRPPVRLGPLKLPPAYVAPC